jgi:hypothetical protein
MKNEVVYEAPTVTVVEVNLENAILFSSGPTQSQMYIIYGEETI